MGAPSEAPDDFLIDLRRPFTEWAVNFKIQTGGGTETDRKRAMIVCYIDARLVVERLNRVVGFDWSDAYAWIGGPKPSLECRLTVRGTTRCDVGLFGSGQEGDTPKAIYSDALKRAAVKFGVGVPLYATPRIFLEPAMLRYYGGKVRGIEDTGLKWCRDRYRQWLQTHGVRAFGEPLDHGDVEDSAGDYEANETTEQRTEQREARRDDRPATESQIRRLFALLHDMPELGDDSPNEAVHKLVAWVTREDPGGAVTSLRDLTRDQVQRVYTVMERCQSPDVAGKVAAALDEWTQTYADLLMMKGADVPPGSDYGG